LQELRDLHLNPRHEPYKSSNSINHDMRMPMAYARRQAWGLHQYATTRKGKETDK